MSPGPSHQAEQKERLAVLKNEQQSNLRPGDYEPSTLHEMANLGSTRTFPAGVPRAIMSRGVRWQRTIRPFHPGHGRAITRSCLMSRRSATRSRKSPRHTLRDRREHGWGYGSNIVTATADVVETTRVNPSMKRRKL